VISLQAFDFQPLVRVVFGPGSLERLGELTRELGGQRVLLVTDPGLEQAGHPQRAAQVLSRAGLSVAIFDGVEENPTTQHVEAGVRAARAAGCDFLVAVGGGSAMDVAKGINFLLTNGGSMADYWGSGKARLPMLPSIGVPTTAGTGSEAQSYALIADPVTHRKMACGDRKAAFRVAILDPELTLTQPDRVTADTGMDALSHALEAYVTARRNPLSQALAREAWRLLVHHFPTVLRQPDHLPARAGMQLGAHFAGWAIETSMLGATHALANPLTAHYGLPHGQAIALLLPHVLRFNAAAVEPLYADLARDAGLDVPSAEGAGEVLARHVSSLARAAGLPARLAEVGVHEAILPVLAEEAAEQWTGRFNPRPVGAAELLQLYRQAY
jgi:alcohol dehydrogenase